MLLTSCLPANRVVKSAGGYTTRTARATAKGLAPRWDRRGTVGDFSRLLERWKRGDTGAGDQVVALTYAELRRVAHGFVRRERAGFSLQTTGLLHEAYVRLLRKGPGSADTKEAFFRLMAAEMRHRLIDHARRRLAEKRGGRVVHE